MKINNIRWPAFDKIKSPNNSRLTQFWKIFVNPNFVIYYSIELLARNVLSNVGQTKLITPFKYVAPERSSFEKKINEAIEIIEYEHSSMICNRKFNNTHLKNKTALPK